MSELIVRTAESLTVRYFHGNNVCEYDSSAVTTEAQRWRSRWLKTFQEQVFELWARRRSSWCCSQKVCSRISGVYNYNGLRSLLRMFQFYSYDDWHDIAKIIDAFQRHCIGEANITYERYVFHQGFQHTGVLTTSCTFYVLQCTCTSWFFSNLTWQSNSRL